MKSLQLQFFVVFFFISIFLALLDSQKLITPVRSLSHGILLPGVQLVWSVRGAAVNSYSVLTFWRSGENRIKDLERRNLELLVKANQTDALRGENEELRKQLGVRQLEKRKQLSVKVLGISSWIIVNAGIKEGVKEGNSVVYGLNLVGRVVRTNDHSSFVEMPTATDSKISVRVGRSTVKGIAIGQFNSSIILDQVAQTEAIPIGELIYTTGEDQNFEPDLVVGKVTGILSAQTDVFKKAKLEQLFKPSELTNVFVILN